MKKEISIGKGQTSIHIEKQKGIPGKKPEFTIILMNEHGYMHAAYMTLEGLEDLGGEVQKYFQEFMTREDV